MEIITLLIPVYVGIGTLLIKEVFKYMRNVKKLKSDCCFGELELTNDDNSSSSTKDE